VLYSLLPHQGGNGLFLDNNPIGLNPAIIPTAEIEGGRCPLGYFVCDDNRAQCGKWHRELSSGLENFIFYSKLFFFSSPTTLDMQWTGGV